MNNVFTDILASDVFGGVVGIVVGVLLIVFRKPFARKTVRDQNAFWGFRMGERHVRISELVAVPIGIGFIVMGVWMLLDAFGVLHY
jgi:hypothetical protein